MSPKQRAAYGIEYALLGFFAEQPLHGYEVYQRLQSAEAVGLVWRVKQAHLYAILTRMETDGLIAGEEISQAGRPPKRLLHLTGAGQAAFDHWLHTPVTHGRDLRMEFLAKLFWAQQRGGDRATRLIFVQRATCEQWLHEINDEAASVPDALYARLVIEFRRSQIAAMIAWLDTCATLIAAPPP